MEILMQTAERISTVHQNAYMSGMHACVVFSALLTCRYSAGLQSCIRRLPPFIFVTAQSFSCMHKSAVSKIEISRFIAGQKELPLTQVQQLCKFCNMLCVHSSRKQTKMQRNHFQLGPAEVQAVLRVAPIPGPPTDPLPDTVPPPLLLPLADPDCEVGRSIRCDGTIPPALVMPRRRDTNTRGASPLSASGVPLPGSGDGGAVCNARMF